MKHFGNYTSIWLFQRAYVQVADHCATINYKNRNSRVYFRKILINDILHLEHFHFLKS